MSTTSNHVKYLNSCLYLFVAFSLTAHLFSPPAKAAEKGGAGSLINMADEELWKMNYPKADSIYTAELRKHPESVELYWKLSRLRVSMGESTYPKNSDARLQLYRKAAEYAHASISLDSTNANGHTWLAASLGMMADKVGAKEKLRRATEIKRELDTALRLNPNDATALSLLGSYYREAANIGWFKRMFANTFIGEVPSGNYELAEQAFRKAITLNPKIIRNYHELALICIEKHNTTEALRLMKIALDKPVLIESDKKRIKEMSVLLKKYSQE